VNVVKRKYAVDNHGDAPEDLVVGARVDLTRIAINGVMIGLRAGIYL
jgi:hypothetical protein